MNWRELTGFGAMIAGAATIALSACTHEPARQATPTIPAATVVILGNKVAPAPKCTCEDEIAAADRRAAHWKAYAEKLEAQLGIPPASASSGDLP